MKTQGWFALNKKHNLRVENQMRSLFKTLLHTSNTLSVSTARNTLFNVTPRRGYAKDTKLNVKHYIPRTTNLFKVGGNKVAIDSLADIVRYLDEPAKFLRFGAKPPLTYILSGPPGVGKSMLAEAVAGHANLPFVLVNGSELIGEYVGEGERLIRQLFDYARDLSPCVLCIDEIDSIGSARFSVSKSSAELHANTIVNQLLTLLAQNNENVFIVATTNNFKALDPALVRAGRFERHIVLTIPTVEEREHILKIQTANRPLASNLSFKTLAKLTPGFSGAQLAQWTDFAAQCAIRRGDELISSDHFDQALTMTLSGGMLQEEHKNKQIKQDTAIHEAGHALVAHAYGRTVHQISIYPLGPSRGHTHIVPDDDNGPVTKQILLEDIAICMAGRAAEYLKNIVQAGSSSDIENATRLATNYIREGMGKTISGVVNQMEIEYLLESQLLIALEMLSQKEALLDRLVETLVEKNQLNQKEFTDIMRRNTKTFGGLSISFFNDKHTMTKPIFELPALRFPR